jgi:hypothetical protein
MTRLLIAVLATAFSLAAATAVFAEEKKPEPPKPPVTQDVTVNKARSADKAWKAMDAYIRS